MLEVFIPLKIKNNLKINYFSDKLWTIMKNSFLGIEIKVFETELLTWIYLNTKNIDLDLIRLLNWEYGRFYFVDYDFLWNSINSFWIKILKPDDISEKIKDIYLNFEEIILELKSSKLLTISKKEEIKTKINEVFFTLSWIYFVLYKLKTKTESNLKDLNSYNWLAEYEWQASLLSEVSKTRKIELEATIMKFEKQVEMFLETVNSLFIR